MHVCQIWRRKNLVVYLERLEFIPVSAAGLIEGGWVRLLCLAWLVWQPATWDCGWLFVCKIGREGR